MTGRSPANMDRIGFNEAPQAVVTGNVTGATSLDLSAANLFQHTLTGNVTFSFTNPSSSPAGNSFVLVIVQDATGGRTVTWPASVLWDSGTAPTISSSANAVDLFTFISPDGGTTWYGLTGAQALA